MKYNNLDDSTDITDSNVNTKNTDDDIQNIKQTVLETEKILKKGQWSHVKKIIFKFKQRFFYYSFDSDKYIYFPGKIDNDQIILENAVSCIFDKDNKIISSEIDSVDSNLSELKIFLNKKNIQKHKKLTHKTNKKRKKHTHKFFSTYFDVSLSK